MSHSISQNRIDPRALELSDGTTTQLSQFIAFCESRTGGRLDDERALHEFSVADPGRFWSLFLEWSDPIVAGRREPALAGRDCETARFFPGLRLNYAENLLRLGPELPAEAPAVAAHHPFRGPERLTRGELLQRTQRLAARLRALDVGEGDRVMAVAGNNAALAVAGLAAAACGATFSSASPDMGIPALLSRCLQLSPKVLFANLVDDAQSGPAALSARIGDLARELPSLAAVVGLDEGPEPERLRVPFERLGEIVDRAPEGGATDWPRPRFDHPLFALFSSGTTGPPKGILHGTGGTLLEHLKEHRLHVDLRPGDKLFFHSSAAWMMWNWQLSALATGCEIVLYDGPISGPETLWRIVGSEGVTVFGTSPSYLQLCEDSRYAPRTDTDLGSLRTVLSTGAILHDHQYDWCRDQVGEVPLQSISGGTDIIGCFVLGNPNRPVRRGWIQCRSLAMDVQAVPEDGGEPTTGAVGELICRTPFPSRPVGLIGDDGRAFHDAYFSENPGAWTHGDLIEFDEDGQARMHGRSDGVLEIRGVRVGPADIYRALAAVPEVKEALAVEQRGADPRGYSRSVLLLVLHPPHRLDGRLTVRVRREIVTQIAATHVPDLIVQVPELPVTHNGKHSERAARDALGGTGVANLDALRNPESLSKIREEVERGRSRREQAGDGARAGGPSTEATLRAIWENVLGVAPLRPTDNFFELGGTSLAAVRVFQAIHDELGVDLPLSTLMRAQTTAELAAIVDTFEDSEIPCIVPLRAAAGGRPLFLVHSLTGDVLQMRALALSLGGDRSVYGIQAVGLDPVRAPQASVEEMARTYVDAIVSLQPSGPYDLAGHSFGGLVAFEMARQLNARGLTVGWLGLIDANVHPGCLPPARRLAFRASQPFRFVRAALHAPRTRMERYFRKALLRVVPSLPIAPPAPLWPLPPLLRRIEAVNLDAYAAYRPGAYGGPATLFLAEQREPNACNPVPVWSSVVDGGLELERVPGGHLNLVVEPHVGVLAERMTEKLA
ncbi:MAG: acetoacetate--CoA ligase [Thermoleophilaceae bacterium]|nr:acetoacetate--CoA ligase [Thermoleophilaceae bacterium]